MNGSAVPATVMEPDLTMIDMQIRYPPRLVGRLRAVVDCPLAATLTTGPYA